jgi:phage terminase large subunit-like protein
MNLDKSSATERIDLLAALINALAGAVSDPENNGPSVYETRGILTL